ncbi:hypothetical protein ABVT39_027678 [Epinephelus coioides]
MIRMCRYRYLKQKNLERPELLTRLGQTAKENNGEHVSWDVFEDASKSKPIRAASNLVLCGRRGAGKTSAAKAILGQTELHSVSSSSECVKHQGEVCGRWVSLVELPALYGKPQEAVMEESFRCISLCDPEGVHAFILVLPVRPLTDEDKKELETIRNTFSSRVNDFTLILFTVESDPTAPAIKFIKKNRDIQELCQSCGGRYVVLNIKDQQQIPELLDAVEKMMAEGSRCFTKDTFTKAQLENVSRLKAELQDVKQRTSVGHFQVDISVKGFQHSESSAVSEQCDLDPLKRNNSLVFLPPAMSELRVVLLGNSWSQRSSVGNFILGETKFNTEEEPDCCLRGTRKIGVQKIAVINTPDLLHLNISEDKLSEHVENCVRLSDPGPHVFLLVLQPEDFTEEHKLRLCRVLKLFSHQSFDHSLILISTPREKSSGFTEDVTNHPALQDMNRRCRFGSITPKNLSELLTRLGQTAKENKGKSVSCDSLREAATALTQSLKHGEAVSAQIGPAGAAADGLRVVLFGQSDDKTALSDFIMKKSAFTSQRDSKSKRCEVDHGEWRNKPLTLVKTPDIFSLSEEKVKRFMKECVSQCPPGPNVILLLVKPSTFTEVNRQTLKFILSLFDQDAFKHSMVIMTHEESKASLPLSQLLKDCGGRYYSMLEDNHRLLMKKIENIVSENKGTFLTFTEEPIRAALNLVLCGRRGAGKTSAAKAILGQTELHSVSSSSECVKHQGEVCGRWVSLVELPALYGKPQEAVMEESFRCISLCDSEGVHAFILVLPVGPLTDEDKKELETIRDTFSSRVNHFTLILFTVESDPTAPAVDNFIKKNRDIQELCQSCGGRYVVLNIKDQQQIPELLDAVEKMMAEGSSCFTKDTFTKAQLENVSRLKAELQDVKQRRL